MKPNLSYMSVEHLRVQTSKLNIQFDNIPYFLITLMKRSANIWKYHCSYYQIYFSIMLNLYLKNTKYTIAHHFSHHLSVNVRYLHLVTLIRRYYSDFRSNPSGLPSSCRSVSLFKDFLLTGLVISGYKTVPKIEHIELDSQNSTCNRTRNHMFLGV